MKHILLLHGAIGAIDQLSDLEKNLTTSFIVHKLNFSGHGGFASNMQPFSIKLFAADVLSFLEREKIELINIFGYSMGG